MKFFITIILLIIAGIAFAQDDEITGPDSLSVVQIDCRTLNDNMVTELRKDINVDTCSFFAYGDQKQYLAYANNKRQWFSITPTDAYASLQDVSIEEISKIKATKKNQLAFVFKGILRSYGTGGGSGEYWLTVINVDSVVTGIFNVHYGCWEESFGDRQNNGEGSYANEFTRKVVVSDSTVVISAMEHQDAIEDCQLTKIAAGTYILDNGHMRKMKP